MPAQQHATGWGDALRQAHETPWGDALRQAHIAEWVFLQPNAAGHATGWADMQPLAAGHQVAWALLAAHAVTNQADWAINTTNPRARNHRAAWSMPMAAHLRAVENTPTLTHAGRTIGMHAASLSCDENSPVWLARLVLESVADYAAISVGDPIALALGAEAFAFVVDGKALSRPGPDTEITAMSPACLHDAPFAEQIDIDWHGSAQALVESLVGPVEWHLPDWIIPTGQAVFASATSLQIVRAVVDAIGGLVESAPDGTIICRRRHPINIPDYAIATPDHTLTDGDILGMSATIAPVRNFDRVTISNDTWGEAQASRSEYLADENSQSSGTIRVWPAAGKTVDLVHTGNPATTLQALGPVVRSNTEVIEFISGLGTTQFPVTSITTATWQRANLGSVAASGAQLSSSIPGYSLLALTYTTTAHEWRVALEEDEAVQFILMES